MKRYGPVLWLSMGASLLLHLALAAPFFCVPNWPHQEKQSYTVATFVTIKRAPIKPPQLPAPEPVIEKPAPKPQPKQKAKIKPKPKKKQNQRPQAAPIKPKRASNRTAPAANKRKINDEAHHKESIRPVFGLTPESVRRDGDASPSARVGNTLMMPQEEAFTPPEQVEDYPAVPPFELSSLPLYKTRVTPIYPESLKAAGKQGEVLLAVTIDEQGRVVGLKVKRSDDALFSEAALAALKRCRFTPGLRNGTPVTTTIDIPIKFMLDD